MSDLAQLTHASFAPHVGTAFVIDADAEPIALTLADVKVHPFPGPTREPFSLFFRGPAERVLAQGTYALAHEELGRLEIFLVPVGRDADGTEYEAAFN